MGVPTSEVGYTSATTGRGDHKVHKGHVVALREIFWNLYSLVVYWSEFLTIDNGVPDFKSRLYRGDFSFKGKIPMVTIVWVV
jgi:hypothetical protein